MSDDDARYELGTTFHRALITKDWDLLRTLLTPDATWVLPGDNVISGEVVGAEAVIERGALIASYGVSFTLESVQVSRDDMALGIHNTAQRAGAVLDEKVSTVCRVQEGRIAAIETYLSDVAGMDAFFVPLG